MITIEEQLRGFFEKAWTFEAEQVLAWISKTQSLISKLPDAQSTLLDEGKTLQITVHALTILGNFRYRSITAIGENYHCICFGHISINYIDGEAYVSSGGRRIAIWRNTEFYFVE